MMYGAQVDAIVKKLMKEGALPLSSINDAVLTACLLSVYPHMGVSDEQMRNYIREHQSDTAVQDMMAKMKEITTGVISIPEEEFPAEFGMEALKEMVIISDIKPNSYDYCTLLRLWHRRR